MEDGNVEELSCAQSSPMRSSKRNTRPVKRLMEDQATEEVVKKSKTKPSAKSVKMDSFETAKSSLLCMPTISESEAEEALKAIGEPFGLNTAMQYIHEKRRDPGDIYTQSKREKFQPYLGLKIRVGEGKDPSLGEVTSEGHKKKVDGGLLLMWEVTYTDGEKGEMDWLQLYEARADRPRKTSNPRGRPLEFLHLLAKDDMDASNGSMEAQQFVQRLWKSRTAVMGSVSANSFLYSSSDDGDGDGDDDNGTPDCIWASPTSPKDLNASFSQMVKVALKINPHMILVVENNHASGNLSDIPCCMTELETSVGLRRVDVPYCGLDQSCNQHPTHLWTNHFELAATLNAFCGEDTCPHSDDGLDPSSSDGTTNTSSSEKKMNPKHRRTQIPDAIVEEIVEYVDATFELAQVRRIETRNKLLIANIIGTVPFNPTMATFIRRGYSFYTKLDDDQFYRGSVTGGPEPVMEIATTGKVVLNSNWRVRYDNGTEKSMTAEQILNCVPRNPVRPPATNTASDVHLHVGYVFFKRFDDDSFYQGSIIRGPERVRDKESRAYVLIWRVKYDDDGDEEDLLPEEILSCPRENPTRRLAAAHKARSKPVTPIEKSRNALIYIPGVTEEEVEAALKVTGPTYSIRAALSHIHAERLRLKNYTNVQAFHPFIGMKIRYPSLGAQYLGEVTGGPTMKDVENGTLKMWEVTYEDEGIDDMHYGQLIQAWAGRPIRTHPHRGRPLGGLELFSGCGMISQEFTQRMWRMRSIDNDHRSNASDKIDLMTFEMKDTGFVPDFIWASPPCFTYSILAGGKHRSTDAGFEKTKEALEQNHLFTKMVQIIHEAKAVHPHLIVVIENPRGLLQSMPLMKELESSMNLEKVEVHYCAFGRGDKKPTHLWTNDLGLASRLSGFQCNKKCPYKDGIHPMGVRGQGSKFNAAAIPGGLAEEVAAYVNCKFIMDRIRFTKSHPLQTHTEQSTAVTVTDSSSDNTSTGD